MKAHLYFSFPEEDYKILRFSHGVYQDYRHVVLKQCPVYEFEYGFHYYFGRRENELRRSVSAIYDQRVASSEFRVTCRGGILELEAARVNDSLSVFFDDHLRRPEHLSRRDKLNRVAAQGERFSVRGRKNRRAFNFFPQKLYRFGSSYDFFASGQLVEVRA